MANEMLRLKQDVLNELRNDKYYTQDDLRIIVENSSMSQRDKVNKVIETVTRMVNLDSKIQLVDNIFAEPAPQPSTQPEATQFSPEPQEVGVDAPAVDNVVEAPAVDNVVEDRVAPAVDNVVEADLQAKSDDVAVLNTQGQTHAE